jgi:hypothetical protein
MANDPRTFHLRHSAPVFDIGEQKADWPIWKMQWRAFLATSGINRLVTTDNDDAVRLAKERACAEIKVGALHEALSRDTLRVVRNLPLTDAQRLSADATVAALETFIDRGTNKRVYRCKLAGRQRDPNEPLEDFLVAIKDLAVRCKYTAAADDNAAMEDHLFDALITNINDQEVTEKLLQLDDAKTFDDAVKVAQSILTARHDATTVTGSTPAAAAARFRPANLGTGTTKPKGPKGKCKRCGYPNHDKGKECPATKEKCRHCDAIGHFNRCCPNRSKDGKTGPPTKANAAGHSDTEEDDTVAGANPLMLSFELAAGALPRDGREPLERLDVVKVNLAATRAPHLTMANLPFLPDSGANFTTIPPAMMKEMGIRRRQLRGSKPPPPAPRLADGSRSGLCPLGFFRGTLTFRGDSCHADIYVTKGLHQPLLSRAACFALGILRSDVLPGGRGKDSPQ